AQVAHRAAVFAEFCGVFGANDRRKAEQQSRRHAPLQSGHPVIRNARLWKKAAAAAYRIARSSQAMTSREAVLQTRKIISRNDGPELCSRRRALLRERAQGRPGCGLHLDVSSRKPKKNKTDACEQLRFNRAHPGFPCKLMVPPQSHSLTWRHGAKGRDVVKPI